MRYLQASALLFGMMSPTLGAPADCKTIPDDKERLACFDKAASEPVAGQKPAAPKAPADPLLTKARSAVANSLKDPPSARFDGIVRKPEAVCGYVNAKNSYGGYTGRTRFVYVMKSGEVLLEVPITSLNTTNLTEYETSEAALTKYCPGVRSPFVKP